jgi:CRP/FNR family transcriptional regulator, cyclic AMP receptor protein
MRDTARMETWLALAEDLPRQSLAEGDTLLVEGTRSGQLFVLLDGVLRVEKGGVPITSISERGACVGEVSLLLDVPATADVVASEPTTVAVIDDAARVLTSDPNASLALARLLATRVQHMTTYLADIQRQYADHEGGLGMVGTVLGSLMHRSSDARSELRSARDPEPEY